MTGTLWHSYFEQVFRDARLPVITELKLDRWLPEGWSGTADWIIWDRNAFVLGDLKTIKGEGLPFVVKEGIKEEHLWQLSSYWYALRNMGLPLVKGFAVFYLPMNGVVGKDIEPVQAWGQPIPEDVILPVMEERWKATSLYYNSVWEGNLYGPNKPTHEFNNQYLAPVQERIQKITWNAKTEVFDVKLVPHWSAQFCPYPDELCDCRNQGVTKIGHYTLDSGYVPYKGHQAQPIPLDGKMLAQRRKAANEAS